MGKKSVLLLFAAMLCLPALLQAQEYPLVTIEEIQFVENPELDDETPLFGDTVRVRGLVMSDVRKLWVNARWACFVVDPDNPSAPWNSFFIIQHDTSASGTQFGFVQPGMICTFTGVVDEFDSFSQMALLTGDDLVPVEIESAGNPLPTPIELSTADLTDLAAGEQWESQFAIIPFATITNNDFDSNRAVISDASGLPTTIDDYFFFFRGMFDDGVYEWPSTGTVVDVTGFVRGLGEEFSINPRNFDDLVLLSEPPTTTNILRDPGIPASSDAVSISATITDNFTVEDAVVHYSVNWGSFQELNMSNDEGDTWSATIPAQAEGSYVRYFVAAEDGKGLSSQVPGDTSFATGGVFYYVVRDEGLSIRDVQYNFGYASGASGYEGYEVTLEGVVMTDSIDFLGDYYIQEAADEWSGIRVNDGNITHVKGDWIAVTGTIDENFGQTRIDDVSASVVVTPGFGDFEAVLANTGDLANAATGGEAYEGVLVRFENVTVVDTLPDAPSNFGEFTIENDGSELRVDDNSSQYDGNLLHGISPGAFGFVQGMHDYSFGDYKVLPRNAADVDLIVGIEDEVQVPFEFSLEQNYPNPFNPETRVDFTIAKTGAYQVEIFNILGQSVRTLANGTLPAGQHQLQWNGLNDNGDRVATGLYIYQLRGNDISLSKKMLLIK